MQSSRGQPPHGADPSPTDRSHTHTALPSSFQSSESLPSSPPFFSMNPLTDQRLTGPMMSYQPVDHHSLSRYAHIHTLARTLLITVDDSPFVTHRLSTSTYQDSVSWQYAAPWDSVLGAGASSENPSSTPIHPLSGMVSPSHEGSSYAPPLPPLRAVQNRNHYLGATHS